MKSKGFVFIETIVVIVILSIGLIMVYQSFTNVITNSKRRASYNDVDYVYRTYYIEEFITSLNIDGFINNFLVKEGKKIQTFYCANPILYNIDINLNDTGVSGLVNQMTGAEKNKYQFCENILNKFKVKNIYITNYNVNDLKQCTTRGGKLANSAACNMNNAANREKFDALTSFSPSMIYYLRTLNGTLANRYRLIVEYEENFIDADSTINKVMRYGSLVCPNTYTNVGGVCQKTIKKRYYANVALIKKG